MSDRTQIGANPVTRVLALALVLALAGVAAAPAARLEGVFALRAEISVPASTPEDAALVRLELPPEVLAACREDLSDLRVLGADGEEIPFLVQESRTSPQLERQTTVRVAGELVGLDRSEVRRTDGPPLLREILTVDFRELEGDLGSAGPPIRSWDLVVESAMRRFVRRVQVEIVPAEGTPSGNRLVAEGSVFRIDAPPRERLRLALPDGLAPPARLRVSFEGEEEGQGGYLQAQLYLEGSRRLPALPPQEVELTLVESAQEGDSSVALLARPRGLLPEALLLETTTAAFHRPVVVRDDGPGAGDEVLARATLFRLPGEPTVEERILPLEQRPRGDRLRVVIANGDSPPLEGLRFLARLPRVALILPLPPEGGRLLFGGGRTHRPRYDLARFGDGQLDPRRLVPATLGPLQENPAFDAAPALAFAFHPGAPLDPKPYPLRRRLDVPETPEGLVRWRLGPQDLAAAGPDLAALRVVDGESRQWAYLLDREGVYTTAELPVDGPLAEGSRSVYRFDLPAESIPVDRLELRTSGTFFDRAFTLTGLVASESGGSEAVARTRLLEGRLLRRPGEEDPLVLAFAPERCIALELTVETGGDAPLTFTAARARLPAADLYLVAPADTYRLLLGKADAERPTYELARVRDLVLAVEAVEVRAGEVEHGGGWWPGLLRQATSPTFERGLMWVVLTLAAAVLAVWSLRLARGQSKQD